MYINITDISLTCIHFVLLKQPHIGCTPSNKQARRLEVGAIAFIGLDLLNMIKKEY